MKIEGQPLLQNSNNSTPYWNFGEGANPQFSSAANPTVTYNEYGSHGVTLEVCNGSILEESSACNQLTRQNYIYILDEIEVEESGVNQNFDSPNFPEDDGCLLYTSPSPRDQA